MSCKRARIVLVLLLHVVGVSAVAQQPRYDFNPRNSFSIFAEYSNTSSHILIGEAFNRRLAAVGASYSHRESSGPHVVWRYQLDVRPLIFLQDPTASYVIDYSPFGLPVDRIPATPVVNSCKSFQIPENLLRGTPAVTKTCGTRWTYSGGISPIGQKMNLFPQRRLQPFFAANSGFVVATRDIPLDASTMFNFTFEAGAGLEWYVRPGRSWSLDWRYHHISNAGRGEQNAGIDSGILKLTYTFSH